MFESHSVLENIKHFFVYNNDLVICSQDQGTTVYKDEKPIKLSSIKASIGSYAVIFNNYLLFQNTNGTNVKYFNLDELRANTDKIEGKLYLSDYFVDGSHIYLPTRNSLREFDMNMQEVKSFAIKSVPNAICNGKFYQLYPHLSCFSLKDGTKIWELENDKLLIAKIFLRDRTFSIKNDLLIVKSPWVEDGNYLTGLDCSTGNIKWQIKEIIAHKTYIDDNIFILYYHSVRAGSTIALRGKLCIINSKNGEFLKDLDITDEWTKNGFRTADHYHLAKDGNNLYIAATYNKSIHQFNIETGHIEWSHKVNTQAEWISDIKSSNGSLFVSDQLGMLHIFKRS